MLDLYTSPLYSSVCTHSILLTHSPHAPYQYVLIVLSRMDNEVVIRNLLPFVTPVQVYAVFSVLNKSITAMIKWHVDPVAWPDLHCHRGPYWPIARDYLKRGDRQGLKNILLAKLGQDATAVMSMEAPNGDILLHQFARKGETNLVDMLLRYTAPVADWFGDWDSSDSSMPEFDEDHMYKPAYELRRKGAGGMTALHCAAFARSEATCRLLLLAGANAGARDDIGRYPENWATVQQAHDLSQFLRRVRKGKIKYTHPWYPY